jgi:hypothetical protein
MKEKESNQDVATLIISHSNQIQMLSVRKIIATVLWDNKSVHLVDFLDHGDTITAQLYCGTLERFWLAISNERPGLSQHSIVILHNNAKPHMDNLDSD